MLDKAIAIVILVLAGLPLHWFLRKLGVKVTLVRILTIWVIGALFAFLNFPTKLSGAGFLFYLGIIIMGLATALFLFQLFIVLPKKANDAEFKKLILKANSGSINEYEAHSLLKKAIHYETRGRTEDAKVLYELIVKSNTSFSADALSCLKNLK